MDEGQRAIIQAVAAATTKVLAETKPLEKPHPTTKSLLETPDTDKVTPPDSSDIDLENEPIQKKRERQRSLVLNLGKRLINKTIVVLTLMRSLR
jgi:hypothetical protein